MFLGLGGRHRHIPVEVVRHEQFDGLDIGVFEELLVVRVGLIGAPLLFSLCCPVRVHVAYGKYLGIRASLIRPGVQVADPAASDDGEFDLIHENLHE